MQSTLPISPSAALLDAPCAYPALRLRTVFFRDFWFKFFGTSVFITLFFWAYLYLLKNPTLPVHRIPLTVVDHWIEFAPWALVPYLSLWLYCSLPVMLMPTRTRLVNFGAWIGAMCLVALAIFYRWPNAVPPAHIDWAQYPGVAFLKSVDAAGNACPSLHVATAVYASLWLLGLLRELRLPWPAHALQIIWGVAIVYSTMATKQHVSWDVLAGTVLGVFFAWAGLQWDRKLTGTP